MESFLQVISSLQHFIVIYRGLSVSNWSKRGKCFKFHLLYLTYNTNVRPNQFFATKLTNKTRQNKIEFAVDRQFWQVSFFDSDPNNIGCHSLTSVFLVTYLICNWFTISYYYVIICCHLHILQVQFNVHMYYKSYGVNRSSWSKLFLLQNFMNIDGTTLFSFFLSPPLCAVPQK